MDDIQRLIAAEAIRSLKARYCIAVDTKDGGLLASVLAADAVADFSGAGAAPSGAVMPRRLSITQPLCGRDTIVAAIMKAVSPMVTVHQCATGDVTVEGPGAARATWPVTDLLRIPMEGGDRDVAGYGYYHETYVQEDGGWKIQTLAMSRLRIDTIAGVPS